MHLNCDWSGWIDEMITCLSAEWLFTCFEWMSEWNNGYQPSKQAFNSYILCKVSELWASVFDSLFHFYGMKHNNRAQLIHWKWQLQRRKKEWSSSINYCVRVCNLHIYLRKRTSLPVCRFSSSNVYIHLTLDFMPKCKQLEIASYGARARTPHI